MTDADTIAQSFTRIKLRYTRVSTLIGETISITVDRKTVDFEFDTSGKFLRIV